MTPPSVEGHDGVCFTAGPQAAVMGAGTIHAYLAARREPPRVVAGISLGALNAATMTHVYRARAEAGAGPGGASNPAADAAGWAEFRQYIEFISGKPFDVLWNGMPDPTEFFADLVPICDKTVPESLVHEEADARRRFYLKVKLGRWLARLPISVRLVASTLVNFVRWKERYPPPQRVMGALGNVANIIWLTWLVLWRICVSPQFVPEHLFEARRRAASLPKTLVRAIGWLNLVSSWLWWVLLGVFLLARMVTPPPFVGPLSTNSIFETIFFIVATPLAISAIRLAYRRWKQQLDRWTPMRWVRGAAFVVLAAAIRFVQKKPVQRLLQFLLLAYCAMNAVFVAWAFWFVRHLVLDGLHADLDWHEWIAGAWWLSGLVFAPVMALREAREWLVKQGFLMASPRPLFGWLPYSLAVMNVVSFAFVGAFGVLALAAIIRDGHFGTLINILTHGGVTTIGIALFLQGLLFGVLYFVWKWLSSLATARSARRRMMAVAVSLFVGLSLLYVNMRGQDELMRRLAGTLPALIFGFQQADWHWRLFQTASLGLMITWFALIALAGQPPLRRLTIDAILAKIGLQNGLVPKLYLKVQLQRLFESAGAPRPRIQPGEAGKFPSTVIVASPLQPLRAPKRDLVADQLWARVNTPVVEALDAALSLPWVLGAKRLEQEAEQKHWLREDMRTFPENHHYVSQGVVMVDGTAVRQNPLPALFGFLRRTPDVAAAMEKANSKARPAVHVVYGVPIEARPDVNDGPATSNNIVDIAFNSARLARRRDTQLEVRQTNFISELQSHVNLAGGRGKDSPYAIFADEIAPDGDVMFKNAIAPTREEVLTSVAAGCRRSIEQIYRDELKNWTADGVDAAEVQCSKFLNRGRPAAQLNDAPGLPEVCERCTRKLRRQQGEEVTTDAVHASLSKAPELVREHPQLSGERPRLIFVASGGVFRGAFHIGMLGAFQAAHAKPDLIVGASVGTLMGGALGKMWTSPDDDTLGELVRVFFDVDERVALTRRLKTFARELGVRGRGIRLSPSGVRRMVVAGGRADAGFAATGAPPALIDAISDLLLIPHSATRKIAARFVGGDITGAVRSLIHCLRTQTIVRLDIEEAVIDASLLESVAETLLSNGTAAGRLIRQPFQQAGIAFYGTTTNLRTQSSMLLGGNGDVMFPGAPYDFVEAGLASSAFPAVFAPRAESLVFPGTARADVLLADGGMFDNLPFQPALTILSSAQRGHRATAGKAETAAQLIARRIETPDLVIAGALDPEPATDEESVGALDSLSAVQRRAGTLQNNVKIRSFQLAAERVDAQLVQLRKANPSWLATADPHFVDSVVNAGVLSVFPHSEDHLNGTFAFSRSVGLKRARVRKSIADGCFQTLAGFQRNQAAAQTSAEPSLTARSVASLTNAGKILRISGAKSAEGDTPPDACPFFAIAGKRFTCPFAADVAGRKDAAAIREVFTACGHDANREEAMS